MFKKIILMLVLSLLFVVPVMANGATERTTVQVTGNSQKEVTPDLARIHVSINSIQVDLEQAKNENTQIANQVFAALKAQGVTQEQIKTDTYQVDPIYNYEKDRLPKLKGYRATNSLEIRTSIEKVGILVNELTNAGANEISSIRFEKENESDVKNEALQEAVSDALKKATVIATALHKQIANVKLVNESDVFYRPVMLESRAMKAGNMDMTPTIPSGKVTVGATVQVTVELE